VNVRVVCVWFGECEGGVREGKYGEGVRVLSGRVIDKGRVSSRDDNGSKMVRITVEKGHSREGKGNSREGKGGEGEVCVLREFPLV
jgi:hypothetical protein